MNKKIIISVVALLVVISSITTIFLLKNDKDKIAIDIEDIEESVFKKAMDNGWVRDDGYSQSDIRILKVCEAIEKGKEDFGFDGYYLVLWETNDGKYKEKFLLKDNELSYGGQRYNIYEDRCIKE